MTTTTWDKWTVWSNGKRYLFDTATEMNAFIDQLARERRERIAANVTPWLSQ